ncbi:Inorganic pyrophosphatase [Alternaria alternata]|nr:Inorganic pyrophosphatase [Alternaria alternata]
MSGKLLPGLSTLADNVHGVLLVLALAGKGELVLGLAVWDLVDTEPLVCGTEKTGQVALNVLDVVELGGQWVVHVDNHDLPVSLALVEQSHDTENLDLDDLTRLGDKLTNLADIQWVVVTLGLGLLVNNVGVLPSLYNISTCVIVRYRGRVIVPGGRHRSSRGSPCGGSSSSRSGACPS